MMWYCILSFLSVSLLFPIQSTNCTYRTDALMTASPPHSKAKTLFVARTQQSLIELVRTQNATQRNARSNAMQCKQQRPCSYPPSPVTRQTVIPRIPAAAFHPIPSNPPPSPQIESPTVTKVLPSPQGSLSPPIKFS